MIKIMLFLIVWAPNTQKPVQEGSQEMPSIEVCLEQAGRLARTKPPAGGVILTGCEITDLGPTL
jgi:hypothetical protein